MKRTVSLLLVLLFCLTFLPLTGAVAETPVTRSEILISGLILEAVDTIHKPVVGQKLYSISDCVEVVSTDPAGYESAFKFYTYWYDCENSKTYNADIPAQSNASFTTGTWKLYLHVDSIDSSHYKIDRSNGRFLSDLNRITIGGHSFRLSGISDNGVSYEATFDVAPPIQHVDLTMEEPVVGKKPDFSPVIPEESHCFSADNTTGDWKNDIVWYDDTDSRFMKPDVDVFYPNHVYSVTIWLTPEDGYLFSESITGTMNGNIELDAVNRSDLNQAKFSYTFAQTPDKPLITGKPKTKTVVLGKDAKFGVNAVGSNLTYQWQYSKNNGNTWVNWAGKTKSSFSVKASETNNGCLYRCVVKNSNGSTVSPAARLMVSGVKPRVMAQPVFQTVTVGKDVTFRIFAAGDGMTYQWQYSKDNGSSWVNWTGKTKISFTVKASETNNGCLYRCVVKNSIGSVTSNSARLTVSGVKPNILTQPKSQTIAKGSKVTFHIFAAGTDLSYRWQYSKDGGKTWTNCSSTGSDTDTFCFTSSAALSGRKYRCVVKNNIGTVKSVAVLFKAK